jgi:hypothetical protein
MYNICKADTHCALSGRLSNYKKSRKVNLSYAKIQNENAINPRINFCIQNADSNTLV